MDDALFRCERLAGLQLLEHVVHAREREIRKRRLLPLAMCVELLGEIADALALGVGGEREGEREETGCVRPGGIVANTQAAPGRESPATMDAAGQHSEDVPCLDADRVELVVGAEGKRLDHEDAMFGGLGGEDDAPQATPRLAQVGARPTKQPPVGAKERITVGIAFGLHAIV